MSSLRRLGYGVAAALLLTLTLTLPLTPAAAIARADNPSSPDDTVLDVIDSVLAENGTAHPVPPPPATQSAVPPGD
jgi:hypothetical protein